jgi:hypothetical protein
MIYRPELTKGQAAIGVGICNTGLAHENGAARASQDTQAARVAAPQVDKYRLARIDLHDSARFADAARQAGQATLAQIPIDFRS